jgi:VanZ family protein
VNEPADRGLSTRSKIAAGAFIGVLYAIGMSIRGDVLPGVVGGLLAGILCFLVLREIEQRRDKRERERGDRRGR